MTQYISKSALVAEIERRMKSIRMAFSMQGILHGHDRAYANAQYDAFNSLLSFLDTLEVKEIGLDLGDSKGDTGTKTVFNDSKVLEISRNGNPRIVENGDLEEAARKIGQKYFPDENNIWARPNYEAMAAANAFKEGYHWKEEQCQKTIELAEDHAYLAGQEKMIDKACEFIETYPHLFMGVLRSEVIEDFKNYMKG